MFPQIQETVIQPGDDRTDRSTTAPETHNNNNNATISTLSVEGQISCDFFGVDVARCFFFQWTLDVLQPDI